MPEHGPALCRPDAAPPYWAVLFASVRDERPGDGYGETAARMEELAADRPGYLGLESARAPDGSGLTVSYWRTREDARAWKEVAEHRAAQEAGRARWYREYTVRVARVDEAYGMDPTG